MTTSSTPASTANSNQDLEPLRPLITTLWKHNVHDAMGNRFIPCADSPAQEPLIVTYDDLEKAFSQKAGFLHKACQELAQSPSAAIPLTPIRPLSTAQRLEHDLKEKPEQDSKKTISLDEQLMQDSIKNASRVQELQANVARLLKPIAKSGGPFSLPNKPLDRSRYLLQHLTIWDDIDARRAIAIDVCQHLEETKGSRTEDVEHIRTFELEPLLVLWQTHARDMELVKRLKQRLLLYLCGMLIFSSNLLEFEEAELRSALNDAERALRAMPKVDDSLALKQLRVQVFRAIDKTLNDTSSYAAFRSIWYGFNGYSLGAQIETQTKTGAKPSSALGSVTALIDQLRANGIDVPGSLSVEACINDHQFTEGKNLPRPANERAFIQMNWGAVYLPDGELALVKRAKWALVRTIMLQRDAKAALQKGVQNRIDALREQIDAQAPQHMSTDHREELRTEAHEVRELRKLLSGLTKTFEPLLTDPFGWKADTDGSDQPSSKAPRTTNALINKLYVIQEAYRDYPPAERVWALLTALAPDLCAPQLTNHLMWENPEKRQTFFDAVDNALSQQFESVYPRLPFMQHEEQVVVSDVVKQIVFAALFSPRLLREVMGEDGAEVTQLDVDMTQPFTAGLSLTICPESHQDIVCHPEAAQPGLTNVIVITPQEAQRLAERVALELDGSFEEPYVTIAVLGRATVGRSGDTEQSNEYYCTNEEFLEKISGHENLHYGSVLSDALSDAVWLSKRSHRTINGFISRLTDAEVDSIYRHRMQLADAKRRVSRLHAAILYRAGTFYYADLGSTNGSYLERSGVSFPLTDASDPIALRNGDVIRMGSSTIPSGKALPLTAPLHVTLGARADTGADGR